jgi:glycine oxidase
VASPSDVIVVGAGVVGCAVAYELARRGASVQVVEGRAPGMGATQASAGMLAPFTEARSGGPLLELTARSLALFDSFIAQVVEDGETLTYHRTGALDVAMQGDTVRQLSATAAVLAARGIEAELLDQAALCKAEPEVSHAAIGGLLIPTHGFVRVMELTRALVSAACRRGVRFLEPARARSIAASGSGLAVHTERDILSADRVVLAAGSWAGQVEVEGAGARARVPVKPVRGQLLQLGWTGPALRRVVWSEGCYMVPWTDGTVLVGATMEDVGFDERNTAAGIHDLIEAACGLAPRTWTAGFTEARAGLRPATPDGLPIIGASTVLPKLVYATGHYRNGVLLSALTAQLVADAVLDQILDPMAQFTDPSRFGNI